MSDIIKNKIEKMQADICSADLVLVGIGEEFSEKFLDFEKFGEIKKKNSLNDTYETSTDYLKAVYLHSHSNRDIGIAYEKIGKLLENKNYYIITTCMDNYISHDYFNADRIVQPCGTYEKLHCEENCCEELYDFKDISLLDIAKCPKCGKNLVFNNILSKNYLEIGYLDKWNEYTKWLQGTLNKKLCIIELGVGLQYPTVIRWPFEKIAFYNQKADFYRIHQSLYQMSEELSNRGISISMNSLQLCLNM